MALFYVTGVAGSGKTAIKEYLNSLGCLAFDTDKDRLSGWNHIATNRYMYKEELPPVYPDDWHLHYEWRLTLDKLMPIVDLSQTQDVYLCGTSGNDEVIHHLLDHVYFLCVDEPLIKHRLSNRQNNDYGKLPHELNHILSVYKPAEEYYRNLGATMLDASRPVPELTQTILQSRQMAFQPVGRRN